MSAVRILAPVLAVVGAGAFAQPIVSGSDLWWHLAAGREIASRGAIPELDSFSHTFAGKPWVNHEWLWDLLCWGAYRAHPDLAAGLNLCVLLAVFALAYAASHRVSGSRLAAVVVTWAFAATGHWFFEIRPHVFTLLFTALLLATLHWRYAPALWPLLVAVWVNVHGGFAFGVGAIGLFAGVRTAERSRERGGLVLPLAEWIGVGLALTAVLANPWGSAIVSYPLAYLEAGSAFRDIIEWGAPGFGLDPRSFRGRFWWFALAAAASAPLALRRQAFWVLLPCASFAMAVTALRFIPLFALCAAPLVATGLAAALAALRERAPRLRGEAAGGLAIAAGMVLCAVFWSNVRLAPHLLDRWTEGRRFPHAAVRYLAALGEPLDLFNENTWGGFVMLNAPQLRVFYDGRANTLYDEHLYREFQAVYTARPGFRTRLLRRGVDAALLLRDHSALYRELQTGPDHWRTIYADDLAAILVPPDSPLLARLPDPVLALADEPQGYAHLATRALARGDVNAAIELREAQVEADPLFAPGYGELALLHAMRGDREEVSRVIERGIRAYPRARPRFRVLEASVWERMGEFGRAIRALDDARTGDPAGADARIRARREQLERRLSPEDVR